MSDKIYNWICRTCCCEFSSRRKLAQHYKDLPEHYKKHSSANKSELKKCKFCGKEWVCTNTGLKLHEKCCLDNPNRVDGNSKGKKMSEEFKKRRSENMKERHRNGTASTLSQLRKREKPSYPEQWLMKIIENEKNDGNYIREYRFYTFSLDFCWPDKKKVIEMDGRFHKISEYQKDCDRRKDELLKSEGYEELRIDWEYCFKHPKEIIQKIKEFIGE